MEDIHDIKPIIDGDPKPVMIAVVVILIIVFAITASYAIYYMDKSYRKRLFNNFKKKLIRPFNYKAQALRDLERLEKSFRSHQVNIQVVYFQISEILRRYLEGIYKNNALKKTKSELTQMQIKEVNEILTTCYEVEFAHSNPNIDFTLNFLQLIKTTINKWP